MGIFNKTLEKLRKNSIKDNVKQGPQHQNNITNMFYEIMEATAKEFTEDNWATMEYFLDECYNDAKKKIKKTGYNL